VVHGATEKISEQTIAASHERGGSHVQTTGRSVIENLSRHSEGVSGSSRIIQEAASADRRAPRDPMHPRSSTAAGSALEPHWRDSADKCEYHSDHRRPHDRAPRDSGRLVERCDGPDGQVVRVEPDEDPPRLRTMTPEGHRCADHAFTSCSAENSTMARPMIKRQGRDEAHRSR
jgi:hypothetical protein